MSQLLPVLPVAIPSALACGSKNGQLGMGKLADIGHGGKLEASMVARGWNALWIAGQASGHALTWTPGGTYRTIDNQIAGWLQRTTTDPRQAAATQPTGFPKMYSGQLWWMKPGFAQIALPGTSNHGLGCAIDAAEGTDPASAVYLSHDPDGPGPAQSALAWLLSPYPLASCVAEAFGWSWETQAEPWHLHWVAGDVVPQAVLATEAYIAASS